MASVLTVEQQGIEVFGTFGTTVNPGAGPNDTAGLVLTISDLRPRSITFAWTNGDTRTGTLTVGMVTSAAPELFSGSNLPSNQTPTIELASTTKTFTAGGSETLTLNMETRASADPLDRANYWTTPASLLFSPDNNDRLALVLGITSGSALVMEDFTATADATPEFTGLYTAPSNTHRSRAIECPRCGNWTYEEFLTRDGYTRTLVCETCFDPPDLNERWRARRSREHRPR